MKHFISTLVFLMASFCMPVFAASMQADGQLMLDLRLRPVVSAKSNKVLLTDIVMPIRNSAIDLDKLFFTFDGNKKTRISHADIRHLLKAEIENGLVLKINGPEYVVVKYLGKTLSGKKIQLIASDTLRQQLFDNYIQFEIDPIGRVGDVNIPNGVLEFKASWQKSIKLSSRENVWVDILVNDERVKSIPVWFKVSAHDEVWVLNRNISANMSISTKDLQRVYMDITRLDHRPLMDLNGLANRVVVKGIKAGSVLMTDSLRIRPAVLRGDLVRVQAQVGNVVVETQATALRDGELGDIVKLKTQKQAVLNARVIAKGVLKADVKETAL